MNKSELIEQVAKQSGVDKKTAGQVLNGFEEVVQAVTKAGKEPISWTGFLKIERVSRKKTTARNPQTGDPVPVPAKKVAKVTVGAGFKKVVNGDNPAPKLAK
ncbi:MAG: HU family DNA-binding protein [Acidimicrobiales bacterium]